MIGLFIGIESYNWTWKNVDDCINFCHQNNIEQVILKSYEITQGFWYKQFDTKDSSGLTNIIVRFQEEHIDVIPYGYFYGDNPIAETNAIKQHLARYGKFCMNLESEFDNRPDKAKAFHDALVDVPGTLYCSTWANPVTQQWDKNIMILDDIVDVWMPEVYDDVLLREMYAQFPKVKGKIEPTFHITDTYYLASSIYPNFTLWEYQIAQSNIVELQNFIKTNRGEVVATAPTNSKRMVANYLEVSQFQPGKSEFECGSFAVSLNWRATAPDKVNTYDPGKLIQYAEALYSMVTGSNGANNSAGVSIDDMHKMLKDTQKHPAGPPALHYYDLPIDANSKQADDIARIKAALQHGYPVIATVAENSIVDMELHANPYWWGPSGNHIITYVGIAQDGNLLVCDPANVIKGDGNLQTPKKVQAWPRHYDIHSVKNTWATVVQLPWLPTIPGPDPLKWPAYQPPVVTPPPVQTEDNIKWTYDKNSRQLIAYDGVTVVYRMTVPL